MIQREPSGRNSQEMRPLLMELEFTRYAEGSVLIKMGHTHVLCTASVEDHVPSWLSGKGKGWITAEYSMLPRATHTRTKREREKVSGRTQEIQRLIGRALRSAVDLNQLGERVIVVDCDVLQADGGTRTASITGGCVALGIAISKLISQGKLTSAVWVDTVAAVSVGLKEGTVLVDLDYQEDSCCDVDMNFVMTSKGEFVEIQGTAENKTFSKKDLDHMTSSAAQALDQVHIIQKKALQNLGF